MKQLSSIQVVILFAKTWISGQLFRMAFIIPMLLGWAPLCLAQLPSGIWINPVELANRPTSGAAWEGLVAQANGTCAAPNLADQEDASNVCVLAKALVFARIGGETYRADVMSALRAIVASGTYQGRALALGREIGAYVLSADLISLQTYDPSLDQEFRSKLRELLTTATLEGPRSLVECHEKRPNNWGTHCGGARAAIAAYLGDAAEMARVAQVFKGYLGDRSSFSSFDYGDLSWQCDASQPVGINPAGCMKEGHLIDGVVPDDQRRSGGFTWPPPQESYAYEGLQGALLQATILHRAGYEPFTWENRALLRVYSWLHEQAGFQAEGDDTWQPHVANYFYGTNFPAPTPSRPGKNVGWTDWVFDAAAPPAPTFSPIAGSYDSAQSIAISHPMADAIIHYTLDGSTPTDSSPVYADSIALHEPATIRAIAIIPGWAESAAATATYSFQALMPAFTPPPSLYPTEQSVEILARTAGAAVYYTTDGSTPTTSSAVYANPIAVPRTTTIKAVAALSGLANSDVATATYAVQAPPPTFSPAGGRFTAPQAVTLNTTSGASIFYTIDDSEPTVASTLYLGEQISVSQPTTIKAISVADGFADSPAATASYTFQAASPTLSLAGGNYGSPQSVSLSVSTPDAAIYYTTDGSTPTTSSTAYTEPIAITQNTTLTAIAAVPGWTNSGVATESYVFKPASPSFSPTGRTYNGPQLVSLSVPTSDATIYYTTDGSTPTTSSTPYTEPIAVSQNAVLKAIAAIPGWSNSATETETYTLRSAAPTFDPTGRTYNSPQLVSLSVSTPEATIYYTTDGSTPTTSSTAYTEAIAITQNTVVRAIASVSGWSNSVTETETYTLKPATPIFGLEGKTYDGPQSVSLSVSTPEATIYYTTDGSTPTTSSTPYTEAIAITQNTILKAIAAISGWSNSATETETYSLRPATPAFGVDGGAYNSPQLIAMTVSTPAATIYYTTDGSAPTTSSTSYTAPIPVTRNTILKAIAAIPGWSNSSTKTETYVLRALTPAFSPTGRTYNSPQLVTLTASTPDATIYYTTDGTTPTTSSTLYTAPIPIFQNTILKAIAAIPGWSNSSTETETYTLKLLPPTFNPPHGTYSGAQFITLTSADSNVIIHYTTDGSVPTTSSQIYTEPIPVATSTTIKAIAATPGWAESVVATSTYTIP
jgi:hypothetical protein